MQATFYADVPKKLIDLLPRIRFSVLSPTDAMRALAELEAYVGNIKVVRRRAPGTYKTRVVTLPDTVPAEAVEAINRWDFSRVSTVMITMAMPMVEADLRRRGLL